MNTQTLASADIMVIDDTPENLRLLMKILTDEGHRVRPMVDGELAIAAARQSPPDLVLLDIKMPRLDGYGVCQQLKADDRTRDIPIIFLTVLDEAVDKVRGFTLGAVDYVSKPFETAELLVRINHQLQLRSLQQTLLQQNQQLQAEVAQRKATETALRFSEEKFSKTFQNSPLPSTLIALNTHCYIDVNQAFLEQSGYRLTDVIGKSPTELDLWVNPDDRTLLFEQLQEQGYVHGFEAQLQTKEKQSKQVVLFLEVIQIEQQQYLLTMGEDISARKAAEQKLANKTEQLTQTLETLRETQSDLIQSAKMAALGNLVAGVAHEINTPIGTALLAASTLEVESERFQQILASQPGLRNQAPADPAQASSPVVGVESMMDEIQDYGAVAQECSHLIHCNLHRAGELIQSFKQVAVDQTSLQLRSFNLKTYLEEVLLNLQPTLKRTPHQIQLMGDDAIVLESYPGALSQVITNLIMNSLEHAYFDNQAGQLTLHWAVQDERIQLIYRDDGQGIDPDAMQQLFEPFFTTARHRGGSGLGLHIAYNLVCQTLQGSLSVNSTVGEGTAFTLVLPRSLDA